MLGFSFTTLRFTLAESWESSEILVGMYLGLLCTGSGGGFLAEACTEGALSFCLPGTCACCTWFDEACSEILGGGPVAGGTLAPSAL